MTKLIILAAGRGSRINRLTKENPKALIEINKRSLLSYQLKSIKSAGIKEEDIALITGYKKKNLKNLNLKLFITTNGKKLIWFTH